MNRVSAFLKSPLSYANIYLTAKLSNYYGGFSPNIPVKSFSNSYLESFVQAVEIRQLFTFEDYRVQKGLSRSVFGGD